ncbi:MAG: hypothetical protein AB7G93_17295 [Bdellovibrionales bacterium]
MRSSILSIGFLVFALFTWPAVASDYTPTRVGPDLHDPELEPDYGLGFWNTEIDTTEEDSVGGEMNTKLVGPQEEVDRLYKESLRLQVPRSDANPLFEIFLNFPQTHWNECEDAVTGNYVDYACARRRMISVILNKYLQGSLISCVDAGLKAQGGGTAEAIHIIHAGITADTNHSSQSLHSVNRAIDIKVIQAQLKSGEVRQFTYSKVGNRPFYQALRNCWGKVVRTGNSCPFYRGDAGLTGSIGWENRAHGFHMHLSLPYCMNGRYGPGLWQR